MQRKLPRVTADTAPFWHGGSTGVLNMHYCGSCSRYFHPPAPVCPVCWSLEVGPRAVSGRGTVMTYTVNYQAWHPDLQVPYVVAIIELEEQAGLRITSNVIGVLPEQVTIGMPVRVSFNQQEDIWLPLFEEDK